MKTSSPEGDPGGRSAPLFDAESRRFYSTVLLWLAPLAGGIAGCWPLFALIAWAASVSL